jgi:NDP-sugar pyrophosphorylase family protein
MIQAVILAGGAGTRMGGANKALTNIEGQPFITRLIDNLERVGVNRPLCLTYEWPLRAPDVYHYDEGPVRLGTGGALIHALPKLADPFMVLNGDSYVPGIDYADVRYAWLHAKHEEGMAGLMVVYPTQGNVGMVQGDITSYHKGGMDHAYTDAGIFITSPDKLSQYAEGATPPFDLSVIYTGMIRAGVLAGYETTIVPYEIGSPEGLERYRQAVKEGRA